MPRRLLVTAALAWALSLAEAAPPLDADALGFFRVVKDADGYINVRRGPSASATIQGRVTSGCAVAVYDAKNGWRKLEDDTGAGRTLFVHGADKWTLINGQVLCAWADNWTGALCGPWMMS